MKTIGNKFVFQILLLLAATCLLWSCLEDEAPYEKEPAVKVKFFNIDSLQKLNAAIADIDTVVKHLTTEKTSLSAELSALNSQLSALNKQINEGNTDLIPERDSIQALITEKTARQTEINTSLATQATARTALNKTVGVINRGTILLSRLVANGREVVYDDSASVFSLPLNMNADRQIYYFEIAGKTDSLELTYSLMEDLTAKSYTRLVGTNIERSEGRFSFDSVEVYCNALPDPCISTKTTVNVYF